MSQRTLKLTPKWKGSAIRHSSVESSLSGQTLSVTNIFSFHHRSTYAYVQSRSPNIILQVSEIPKCHNLVKPHLVRSYCLKVQEGHLGLLHTTFHHRTSVNRYTNLQFSPISNTAVQSGTLTTRLKQVCTKLPAKLSQGSGKPTPHLSLNWPTLSQCRKVQKLKICYNILNNLSIIPPTYFIPHPHPSPRHPHTKTLFTPFVTTYQQCSCLSTASNFP